VPNPVDLNLLGVDLASDSDGDIGTVLDDFATISGVDNVINAFVREIVTPFGHLARYAYDVDGLKAVDEDYGNVAYAMLSEPLTNAWVSNMLDHIKDVGESHPRIDLSSVDYDIVTEDLGHVRFSIDFKVLSVPKSYNLVLRNDGSRLLASVTEV
jgi:hypothetical protein